MNKTREILLTVIVIMLAVLAGICGFVTGIPKGELFLHWEFDVGLGLFLLLLFIFSRGQKKNDDQ